ncbi:NACHT domain-containing protein [Bradyrhizobium guangdongense]
MPHSYDLAKLDENSFEHLANSLALKVLGAGHTGFGPGSDGGRDGYFEGEAPYPSPAERWRGKWYLQAKFHRPHLTHDSQKWLLEKINEELKEFSKSGSKRKWPDNWIVVTNVDPSGVPEAGSFDAARAQVASVRPQLADRFHIWGGTKLLQLLAAHPDIAAYYGHFLTPGHILEEMYNQLQDAHASVKAIVRQLVVAQLIEQQFTKLEQAGSPSDQRPGIHKLFTDLPFKSLETGYASLALRDLAKAVAQNHTVVADELGGENWAKWRRHPPRARIWFIKGGPGNGKSTVSQFLCQIQRAALILEPDALTTTSQQKDLAREVRSAAQDSGFWPTAARIPVSLELKEFAKWFGERSDAQARGVLTFLTDRLSQRIEQTVQPGTLKRAFSQGRWLFVFDGLDEVPSDVKGLVAGEIVSFVDDLLVAQRCDALIVCTSRPQGYSGQFDELSSAVVELTPLWPDLALKCAVPVLKIDRTAEEIRQYEETLSEALQTPAIAEIMRTPLQAHIMAVVVRDGGRPPDRKWKLFTNFYQTIKKREANRNLPDRRISGLLRSGDKLLKSLHNRLGFELHARAETKVGAQTSLARDELQLVVNQTVRQLQDSNVQETIQTLMTATTDRLVLVTTPETSDQVRFDIRPLQEFFAAEYLYEGVSADVLGKRVEIISGDAHWREVMHFLLSALIENSRQTELIIAIEKLSDANERFDGPGRSFYRRLCLGGAIASRLLSEGVLEQDRRIRHQFRRCIEPMFGSTDTDLLEPLTDVKSAESLNWLIDIASDSINEQTENESVGAAYVLCILMLDDHPRVPEVFSNLTARPWAYLNCLFDMLYQRYHFVDPETSGKFELPFWVICLLMHVLASDDWKGMGKESVGTALSLITTRSELTFEAAKSVGFDDILSTIVASVLVGGRDANAAPEYSVQGPFFDVAFYEPPATLRVADWSNLEWDALGKATGAFALLKPVLMVAFGKDPTATAIQELESCREFVLSFPENLTAFLPDYLQDKEPSEWIDDRHHGALWSYKPGYHRDVELRSGVDYSGIFQADPQFAFHALSWRYGDDEFQKFVRTPKGIEELTESCLLRPDLLRRNIAIWSDLVELTSAAGKDIRPALLTASRLGGRIVETGARPFKPFLLQLPDEASLLPMVVGAFPSIHYWEARKKSPTAPEFVEAIVPDLKSLTLIATAEDRCKNIRGAAAIMALIHPKCTNDDIAQLIDIVVSCYEPWRENWYLRAAGNALDALVRADDQRAIDGMGMLLRAGMGDFEGRADLNFVLERWRQISKAPVQKRGIGLFRP